MMLQRECTTGRKIIPQGRRVKPVVCGVFPLPSRRGLRLRGGKAKLHPIGVTKTPSTDSIPASPSLKKGMKELKKGSWQNETSLPSNLANYPKGLRKEYLPLKSTKIRLASSFRPFPNDTGKKPAKEIC